jgi:hypothetical protein
MFSLSAASARAALGSVWAIFFLLNLAVAFSLHLRGAIEDDNFFALVAQLNSSYVTYLAAIIGFYVVSATRKVKTPPNVTSYLVAIIASLLWNCGITLFVLPLALGHGRVEDAVKYIGYFAPLFSWVVAPIFTVFFVKTVSD